METSQLFRLLSVGLLIALAPLSLPAVAQPPKQEEQLRRDDQGDLLPTGARLRLGTIRWHHPGAVGALTFSANGRTLASASKQRTIRLWDVATGQVRGQIVSEKIEGMSLALAPDGKTVAFAGQDQSVHLWDVAAGKVTHSLTFPKGFKGTPNSVFAPDGKSLATWDTDGTIRLWEVATGKERSRFPAKAGVKELTFTPDGKTLIGASSNYKIYVWDVVGGKLLHTLEGSKGWPRSLAVSPDGKTLATGGGAEVCLWGLANGGAPRRLTGYQRGVLAVRFSPDGNTLVAVDDTGDCRSWDLATDKMRRQSQLPIRAKDIANPVVTAAFSPAGDTLAWIEWGEFHRIRLWQVSNAKELFTESSQPGVQDLAFSPDGRQLLTTGTEGDFGVWNTTTGKLLRRLTGPEQPGRCLGFALGGQELLFVGKTDAHLLDAVTGKSLRRFPVSGPVWAFAISTDGKTLVVGDHTMERFNIPSCGARFYDLTTGKAGKEWPKCRHGSVTCLALAPDGKSFLTAGLDGYVGLWDAATGKEIHNWGDMSGHVVSLGFRHEGRNKVALQASFFFAENGKEIQKVSCWDMVAGKSLGTWTGPANPRRWCTTFSPKGKYAAFVIYPGTLHIRDALTAKEHCRFEAGQDGIQKIVFSPDERAVASLMGNGTVLVWDLPAPR